MAILLEVVKESAEKFPVSIDFSARLTSGETISSATATSQLRSNLSDSTATIVQGSAGISGGIVTATVHQGTSGDAHIVKLTATTSLGWIYADEILLTITDPI